MADRSFRSARLIKDSDVPKKSIPKPRKAIPCQAADDPEVTHRNFAQAIIAPEVSAFRIVSACEQPGLPDQLDTPALIRLLKDRGEAVNQGDMTHAEAMLSAQATALQTLFTRLAERAMGQSHMPNLESFMRLALRAQSQSRATLETLATIKSPTLVIARQANVSGGAMQVNNGLPASSRTREIQNPPNKLLEEAPDERMDTRATSAAVGADPIMAPLGTIDGAAHG